MYRFAHSFTGTVTQEKNQPIPKLLLQWRELGLKYHVNYFAPRNHVFDFRVVKMNDHFEIFRQMVIAHKRPRYRFKTGFNRSKIPIKRHQVNHQAVVPQEILNHLLCLVFAKTVVHESLD
ncbi:MAG: hypothetical protein BWY42_00832 [Candidatus Omnitrophica bacterium ADurb.Bin277]|nr:MAG: hypothetical protein BWY42_00832 [Candidatus Omnitrophica bacterium ADurb.Bin277]